MTAQAQSANTDGFFPLRLAVGVMLGAVVTLSLFWIMQYLIVSADRTLDTAKRGALVDFVRTQAHRNYSTAPDQTQETTAAQDAAAATADAEAGSLEADGRKKLPSAPRRCKPISN